MHTIEPDMAGLSTAGIERLRAHLQQTVDRQQFAGIIAVIARRDKVAFAETFGWLDIAARQPMPLGAIFRIRSMTKPLISAALMLLVEAGHLRLSDPVTHYIPEFAQLKVLQQTDTGHHELAAPERPVTILHLLTHTAGLRRGADPQHDPVDALYRQNEPDRLDGTLQDMIRRLAIFPLGNHPGRAWRYSIATAVLGHIIEVISGQSLDTFLQERIFAPLGMRDSGFWVPQEKLDRLTPVYTRTEEGLQLFDMPRTSRFARRPIYLSGTGGLVSTAHDYLRFCLMLLNGGELDGARLLERATVELMTRNHLPADVPFYLDFVGETPGLGFGLGFAVVTDPVRAGTPSSAGSYFWGGAYKTVFRIDPAQELILLLMTQIAGSSYPIAEEFISLTYAALND